MQSNPSGPTLLQKVLAIPFLTGGRDWSGCDCYGLVRLVLKELAGVAVPAYARVCGRDVAEEALAIAQALEGRVWLPVPRAEARQFDCLVMRMPFRLSGKWAALDNHIGILVDDRTVLHTAPDIGASTVSLDHPSVQTRIRGFYRHSSLAAP